MSRQNKVNPGMYTQRGRLTPDDAARELQKMRQVGSQHTWQPTKKDALPRRESKDPAAGTETTEDKGSMQETSTSAKTRAAARATARNMAPVKAKPRSTKKTSANGQAKKATGKAKTGKAAKTAAKRNASKPNRKAVLARSVGGGGATPRPAAKRRKG